MDYNIPTDYPQDDIDPRLKDGKWILKNAKYRWEHSKRYCPQDMFWYGRAKYQEIRDYIAGRQSVSKYKKQLLGEKQDDASWYNIDWSVRPIMTTYMEKAVSKVLQRDFNMTCTAINEQAKTDQDAYYNKLRVKLLMREALQQSNPDLLNNPAVKLGEGEPADLQELDMYMQYGYKHTMSMYAEMGINLAFKQNDIHKKRKAAVTSSLGLGLSGYKDWIDENGREKFRDVKPESMVISYCNESDFSDAVDMGEVIFKTFGEIAKYFTKAELEEIKVIAAGQWGNPSIIDSRWQKDVSNFKVAVWDMEFISYNTAVYEEVERKGNMKVGKTDYNIDPEKEQAKAKSKGKPVPEYTREVDEVLYKTCWIIGSDFHYNYGLATNAKRSVSEPRRAFFSYHLDAWNFDKMQFGGLAERLIPLQDEYQMTVYKVQNFKNKWIPYILNIDVSALEKAAVAGKGGKNMTPLELLDFMFQQHILLLRKDAYDDNPGSNYKPVELQRTEMAEDFRVLFEDMSRIVSEMEKIAGFNSVSAGGNVDPRMLSDGYAASLAGTTDSLFLAMESDKRLLERLSMGIIQRQQVAVKLGKVDGYINALGSAATRFMTIPSDISMYDFGIFAEDKPDAAKREAFMQKVSVNEQQGLVLPQDLIMIENCTNLKQAEMLLAFRIDKRKKENQNNLIQSQQVQQQGSVTAAQTAAQLAEQAADKQLERDIAKINAEQQWVYINTKMKVDGGANEAQIHAQSKIIAQQIIEDSKHKLAATAK